MRVRIAFIAVIVISDEVLGEAMQNVVVVIGGGVGMNRRTCNGAVACERKR